MTNRNIASLTRTLTNGHKNVKANPALQAGAVKVLRQLGVIKPPKRTALTQLRKLFR